MMSELEDPFRWLERWYQSRCDGEWEHDHGVTIQSLDNPGWLVTIELQHLVSAQRANDRVLAVVGEPPSDANGNLGGVIWMECKIESGKFVGAGDPTQLRAILAQFRSLVESGAD
jgi:hypothetical protein